MVLQVRDHLICISFLTVMSVLLHQQVQQFWTVSG
jgi:hypothetical protein